MVMLDSVLHAEPADHDALVEEARTAKKHHAAEHVQTVGRSRGWLVPTLLVAAAVVVIVAAQKWAQARGIDIVVTKALESSEARDINSQRGQRGTIALADDSRAQVGSESTLRVPKEFGTSLRTLELKGTAKFDVATGKSLPFTVRAGNMDITATGTSFTVRAFPEDSSVGLMVHEGSVSVHVRDSKDDHAVNSGEAVRIARDGSISPVAGPARDIDFAWTRDSLVFDNARLADVVPQLRRWFDLKLETPDAAVGEKRVSLRLGLQSAGTALDMVAKAAGVTTSFGKDDVMVLR